MSVGIRKATAGSTLARRWLMLAVVYSSFAIGQVWERPAAAQRDPSRAHTIVVPPRGKAGLIEGDTGRSPFSLPRSPQLDWRTRLGALVLGLGTSQGNKKANALLVTTSDGRLLELDSRGLERWAQPLPTAAVAPPLLARSGQRLALTQGAQLVSFTSTGKQRYQRTLPLHTHSSRGRLLELSDGTLLVGWGNAIVLLDSEGHLRSWVELDAELDSWFVEASTILLCTVDGQVFSWDGYFRPRRLGRIPTQSATQWLGAQTGLVVASDAALATRAPMQLQARWLELDAGKFSGALAQTPERGRVVARGTPDLLISADATGELKRWVLSATAPQRNRWSDVLVDDRGTMVTIANNGELAAVSDVVRRLVLSACGSVEELASIGPGTLAASCGDGIIVGITEKTSPD